MLLVGHFLCSFCYKILRLLFIFDLSSDLHGQVQLLLVQVYEWINILLQSYRLLCRGTICSLMTLIYVQRQALDSPEVTKALRKLDTIIYVAEIKRQTKLSDDPILFGYGIFDPLKMWSP